MTKLDWSSGREMNPSVRSVVFDAQARPMMKKRPKDISANRTLKAIFAGKWKISRVQIKRTRKIRWCVGLFYSILVGSMIRMVGIGFLSNTEDSKYSYLSWSKLVFFSFL